MTAQTKPTKQGQICRIIHPSPETNPTEVYLILEDLGPCNDNTVTTVVSLTDLQRNIAHPMMAPRKTVAKSELTVIADDLTTYIESWNRM